MAERSFYLSMNTANRWSTQAKSGLEVEAPALVAALQTMLPAGEFRLSQVLAYGDERLVGPLEWLNFGRTFDAVKLHQVWETGWLDVFTASVVRPQPRL